MWCDKNKTMQPLTVAKQLNSLWDEQNLHKIDAVLSTFVSATPPAHIWLDLVEYSKNKKRPKSLGVYILMFRTKVFQDSATLKQQVEVEDKERALDLAFASHKNLGCMLIHSFDVDKPSLAMVVSRIKDTARNGNLNAGIAIAAQLEIQTEFSIFDLVVPALLQNKVNLLDVYLKGCGTVQDIFFSTVDSWLEPNFDLISFLTDHNIHFAKDTVLQPKFLDKTLARLLKNFGKESSIMELCPNLSNRRAMSTLRYILYRHYVEKATTFENTAELIRKTVQSNVYLQMQLTEILCQTYCDFAAVQYWEKVYNLAPSSIHLTHSPAEKVWDGSSASSIYPKPFENTKPPEIFHQLTLHQNMIHFVSGTDSLTECQRIVLASQTAVGMDAEWSILGGPDKPVALLQLALPDRVFLIDVLWFLKEQCDQMLTMFLSELLKSKNHVKVGFGLKEDLNQLAGCLPGLETHTKAACRIVDLHVVVKHIRQKHSTILDTRGSVNTDVTASSHTGLSKLVQQLFGHGLDKSEQISDWERRPLRPSQVIYAALDAFCLLQIYDILSSRLQAIDSRLTLENIVHGKVQQKRFKDRREQPITGVAAPVKPVSPPVLACEFKVVCDTMLQGLGRQLRCCGIDALILSNFESHERAASLAVQDNRVILTSGSPFMFLSAQVAEGRCLNVPNDLKAADQLCCVLEHFQVKVTPLDIFSRCQLCNSGKYLKVSPQEMLRAKAARQRSCEPVTSTIPWDDVRRQLARESRPSMRTPAATTRQRMPVSVESDFDDGDDEIMFGWDSPKKLEQDCKDTTAIPDSMQHNSKVEKLSASLDNVTVSSAEDKQTYFISPKALSDSSWLDLRNVTLVTDTRGKDETARTPLLCDQVPKAVCNQVKEFYCCIGCGKVYWAGRHFGNVVDKYKDVLCQE